MTEQRALTVSALNRYLKLKFDHDPHLKSIILKGEISNFKHHRSGHMYFTIKDDQSRISAVMFKNSNRVLQFAPKEGMQIVVEGSVSIYDAYGEYQIYVNTMQPDGIGSLYMAFEQLKEKLQKEGLFADKHKQTIPAYPEHIGIITSPTGAAVRDMITTIKRRNPYIQITVLPAIVQGKEAISSIVKQINDANEAHTFDVLLIGRGGGSIEDLWAFNEEKVVRAIFNSKIPIISAVGHETDTTISDFVADVRASTPTGAAEIAVTERSHIIETIRNTERTMTQLLKHRLLDKQKHVNTLKQASPFQHPKRMIEKHRQTIDFIEMRMDQQTKHSFLRKKQQMEQHHIANKKQIIQMKLENNRVTLHQHVHQIGNITLQKWKEKEQKLHVQMEKLMLLNPLHILHRGYTLPFDEKQQLIKTVQDVEEEDSIYIQFHDGTIQANVKQIWRDVDE